MWGQGPKLHDYPSQAVCAAQSRTTWVAAAVFPCLSSPPRAPFWTCERRRNGPQARPRRSTWQRLLQRRRASKWKRRNELQWPEEPHASKEKWKSRQRLLQGKRASRRKRRKRRDRTNRIGKNESIIITQSPSVRPPLQKSKKFMKSIGSNGFMDFMESIKFIKSIKSI